MVDPLQVLYQLKVDGKVPDHLWQLLLQICDAFSISLLDESKFKPTPATLEKKKSKTAPHAA